MFNPPWKVLRLAKASDSEVRCPTPVLVKAHCSMNHVIWGNMDNIDLLKRSFKIWVCSKGHTSSCESKMFEPNGLQMLWTEFNINLYLALAY